MKGDLSAAGVRVLVVDDDPSNLASLRKIFEREGFSVTTATGGAEALEQCRQEAPHVVVTDLMMPGMDGLGLVRALRTVAPDTETVLMTAYGTIETAVQAMREGAYDFVEKPLKRLPILKSVRKAAERRQLRTENQSLKREISALKHPAIVGSSHVLRHAIDVASQAAPSTASILVLGESGTGKELIARHVHDQSGRKGPFVAVNLAALPETIVESELFGHEKGAFTGAIARREGRIAQAAGGTLFLDEIGELSTNVQVKLLRLLQAGEYEPLGGKTQVADFRLVAATNRDLKDAIQRGTFREDLYYRLNVIEILCPRLVDRRDDIPLLAEHFMTKYAEKNGKRIEGISQEAMDRLVGYAWPGNVRELENAIERAVVLTRSPELGLESLPPLLSSAPVVHGALSFPIGTPLEEVERLMIEATLTHTGGDKQLAAQLLGISSRTIYRKLD
ncbi:MAG: sigma-54-dependent Fis family transcriptional regulator [Myxococcales bacterium]|nr:sigma-54-dependent Fis family transcriptional regulator [Myxococcales bacterium]